MGNKTCLFAFLAAAVSPLVAAQASATVVATEGFVRGGVANAKAYADAAVAGKESIISGNEANDGQVLKWDNTSGAWKWADDNNTETNLSGKQDLIGGETSGTVVTNTGTPGTVGSLAIDNTAGGTGSSASLITSGAVNAGLGGKLTSITSANALIEIGNTDPINPVITANGTVIYSPDPDKLDLSQYMSKVPGGSGSQYAGDFDEIIGPFVDGRTFVLQNGVLASVTMDGDKYIFRTVINSGDPNWDEYGADRIRLIEGDISATVGASTNVAYPGTFATDYTHVVDPGGRLGIVTSYDNGQKGSANAKTVSIMTIYVPPSIDGKADKVANAVAGNLAAMDESGNLTDSGLSITLSADTYSE